MAASQTNASTIPQGFSIYQPALGAQLQFLPAIGTPQLDELINAYVPGSASTQEKRATVSLDFLEYAHLTGQTFKFYAVYPINAAVDSPATDSGYGSSFNVSPVTSAWDFSQISTSSRSPTSQQSHRSPKTASSRHQTTDFSNIPGMKIMTKDGRDVTNSASRGSKTKEQRDHAHLMRIIKACDSCRRKKIRCDPSHKKRVAAQSQSQAQATVKSTKKAKAVAQIVAATIPLVDASVPPPIAMDQCFTPIEVDTIAPSLSMLEPWEEFIEYPPAADYDFFYDPAGYFSPESSSGSVYSTKPVTPTSQQDVSVYGLNASETMVASPQLPFNQTESTHNYADFNLFSPESSFSEDEQMVPIELSRHLSNQSYSHQSNTLRSDQDTGGSDIDSRQPAQALDATTWSFSPRQSGEDDNGTYAIYRDPGSSGGDYDSPSSSSMSSDVFSLSTSSIPEAPSQPKTTLEPCYSSGDVAGNHSGAHIDAPLLERVSILAGLRQPDAPHAQRDHEQTLTDSSAVGSISQFTQAVSRDQPSAIYTDVDISELEVSAIAKATNRPSTSSPESSTRTTEDSSPGRSFYPVWETNVANATAGSSSSISEEPICSRYQQASSDDSRVLSGSGVDFQHSKSRLETSGHEQSRIRRGTIASETAIANTDVFHGDGLDVEDKTSRLRGETLGSADRHGRAEIQSQAGQALSEQDIIARETGHKAHNLDAQYGTSASVEGTISLPQVMLTAFLVMSSGSAKSYAQLYLTVAAAIVLMACGTLFPSFSKVSSYSGQPSNPKWNRIETLKSRALSGTKSVNRLMSSASTTPIGMVTSQGMSLMMV